MSELNFYPFRTISHRFFLSGYSIILSRPYGPEIVPVFSKQLVIPQRWGLTVYLLCFSLHRIVSCLSPDGRVWCQRETKQRHNNTPNVDWIKRTINIWDKRTDFLFTWHIWARCWEQTNLARPLKSLGHLLQLKLKLTTAKSLKSSLLGHSFPQTINKASPSRKSRLYFIEVRN